MAFGGDNGNVGSASDGPSGARSGWVSRAELVLGMALAGIAGVWVGRAWIEHTAVSWATALFSLAFGITVAVVGARRGAAPRLRRQYRPPEQRTTVSRRRRERALPLLGELLVHKYQAITERQLQEALTEQRARGGRLGQILVAMGLVEYEQIAEALEDQLSYGDPWRGLAGRLRSDSPAAVLHDLEMRPLE